MSHSNNRDQVYARARSMIVDFAFDEGVASVFPDMIRRSVPGYETIIALVGLIAEQYCQADSHCFDLGCSLGAATLAMQNRIQYPGCRIIAVDNSEAMLQRCRQAISTSTDRARVDIICADINDVHIQNASVVVLNFTLQFIEPDSRLALIEKIYNGMLPGGVLLVSEKIVFENEDEQRHMDELHIAFKKANGYSDLEISQKRNALENVLIPDTYAAHQQRFLQAGFEKSEIWFRCFNFISMLAFKS